MCNPSLASEQKEHLKCLSDPFVLLRRLFVVIAVSAPFEISLRSSFERGKLSLVSSAVPVCFFFKGRENVTAGSKATRHERRSFSSLLFFLAFLERLFFGRPKYIVWCKRGEPFFGSAIVRAQRGLTQRQTWKKAHFLVLACGFFPLFTWGTFPARKSVHVEINGQSTNLPNCNQY